VRLREKPTLPPRRNVFLYGPPKSGKTLALATVPGPLVLLNADLENATWLAHQRRPDLQEIDLEPVDPNDKQPVLRTVLELENAANQRKLDSVETIGVDPVGELYARLVREISGNAVSPAIQVYQQAGVFVERLCRALCKCRKIMSMVDVIGYTARIERADGDPLFVAQLVNAKGRRGGDRFDVLGTKENGYCRPLDLSEWFEALANVGEPSSDNTVTTNAEAEEAVAA
jgi:hypothetical protein